MMMVLPAPLALDTTCLPVAPCLIIPLGPV